MSEDFDAPSPVCIIKTEHHMCKPTMEIQHFGILHPQNPLQIKHIANMIISLMPFSDFQGQCCLVLSLVLHPSPSPCEVRAFFFFFLVFLFCFLIIQYMCFCVSCWYKTTSCFHDKIELGGQQAQKAQITYMHTCIHAQIYICT